MPQIQNAFTTTQTVCVPLTQKSPVLSWPFFRIWRTRHKKETLLHRSISTLWRPPGRAWTEDISQDVKIFKSKNDV